VVVATTMAGALAAGGIVAALGFFRPDTTYMLLDFVPLLFVAGALAGLVHGVVLAWLGRPVPGARGEYRKRLVRGVLWSGPGLAAAAAITFWVTYATVLLGTGRRVWVVLVAAGWIASAIVFLWAAMEWVRVARIALGRWPERRPGLALIAGTFIALMLLLPGGESRGAASNPALSGLSAGLVALGLTLWVAAPVEVLLLRRFGRRRRP
jgi:hypothetical protein